MNYNHSFSFFCNFFSIFFSSILNVVGFISTSTGVPLAKRMELIVEQNVIVVITSSPFLTPKDIKDKCSAAVHEFKDNEYFFFFI